MLSFINEYYKVNDNYKCYIRKTNNNDQSKDKCQDLKCSINKHASLTLADNRNDVSDVRVKHHVYNFRYQCVFRHCACIGFPIDSIVLHNNTHR